MDVKDFYTLEAHNRGAEMRLRSPLTGKLTDCYLTVSGLDSAAWREAELDGKRRILMLNADDSLSEAERKEQSLKITAFVLAKATIGWRGFTHEGKELAFSKERVEELYVNSPNIADQVDAFIGKRANFTNG